MKKYITIDLDKDHAWGIIINLGTCENPRLKLIAKGKETSAKALVNRMNERTEKKSVLLP